MRYIQPLTAEQRALLDKTMRDDPSFRARIRAHSLLLSAQGKTIKDIAQTYQVHRVTVSAWIHKWEQHGAESLHDQPRSGRPCNDVSTLFRTQNPIGFQSLLIGQWREIAIRGMTALTVIEHFDVFKHSCLGVFVRVKPLQINQLGL